MESMTKKVILSLFLCSFFFFLYLIIVQQPIPFVILKVQLKQLVEQYDTTGKGFIFTRDLLTLIDRFEVNKDVVLLSDSQKKAILPYTMSNPDLEMTPDDILNLLKLVCASPQLSISAPTTGSSQVIVESRTRSSGSLKINKSTPWKRRSSIYNNLHKEQQELKVKKQKKRKKIAYLIVMIGNKESIKSKR